MAIAIRISEAQTELEVSIAICNFALEMLVEQLFGETDTDDPDEAAAAVSTYGLTSTQKNRMPRKHLIRQSGRTSGPTAITCATS